jgi:hypothetical protein
MPQTNPANISNSTKPVNVKNNPEGIIIKNPVMLDGEIKEIDIQNKLIILIGQILNSPDKKEAINSKNRKEYDVIVNAKTKIRDEKGAEIKLEDLQKGKRLSIAGQADSSDQQAMQAVVADIIDIIPIATK